VCYSLESRNGAPWRLAIPARNPSEPSLAQPALSQVLSESRHEQTPWSLVLYTDETLSCVDCSNQFTFTAGEQEFFASKGFQNKPNRCPDCRAARKAQRGTSGGGGGSYGGGRDGGGRSGGSREMFTTTCSQCGKTAEVPFQPRGDKPVYCRDCFQTRSSYR